jgi:hypothetical protein
MPAAAAVAARQLQADRIAGVLLCYTQEKFSSIASQRRDAEDSATAAAGEDSYRHAPAVNATSIHMLVGQIG